MKILKSALVVISMMALAACDSSSDNDKTFNLQVLHASPDAPAVSVLVDGDVVLTDFDYKDGSGYVVLDEGTYTIQVNGILPGGEVPVIGPVDLTFERKNTYTIAAVSGVATIEPLVVEQSSESVTGGAGRVLVVHAAEDAPEVDVYVTVPDADLTAAAPLGTFSFKGQIGPAEVPAGDYQIRVTAAGNPAAVVFDSGTVNVANQDDLVIVAVPNTSGGVAPISLVGLVSTGSVEILDVATPTALRVGHLSADTGLVDVLVNGGEYLTDVPFPAVTDFDQLPADTYNVAVTAADMPGVIAIGPVDLDLEAGTWYSVLAINNFANIEPLIATDDPRPVATNAKVRIIHAAAASPAASVDIYVTAVGADIETLAPTLSAVAFKDNTGYLGLAAGDYDVTVTVADTKIVAIGPATLSLAAGDVLTAIARDALPGLGATEFGLVLLEDTLP